MDAKLGDKVKCKVTGFAGTVTAKVEYLNGCVQLLVRPKAAIVKKSEVQKYPEGTYIDVEQLEVIEAKKKAKAKPSGGGVRQHP